MIISPLAKILKAVPNDATLVDVEIVFVLTPPVTVSVPANDPVEFFKAVLALSNAKLAVYCDVLAAVKTILI